MGFAEKFEELHTHYKEILAQTCDNPKDQAIRDRLALGDRLYKEEGHTLTCAVQMTHGGKPCSCGKGPSAPPTTSEEGEKPGMREPQYDDTAKNLEIMGEELAEVGEVLADIASACARAAVIKSKIIRFGIEDCHPERPGVTNRARLELELGHLQAMVKILVRTGLITQEGIDAGEANKMEKLRDWYEDNPHKATRIEDCGCGMGADCMRATEAPANA